MNEAVERDWLRNETKTELRNDWVADFDMDFDNDKSSVRKEGTDLNNSAQRLGTDDSDLELDHEVCENFLLIRFY